MTHKQTIMFAAVALTAALATGCSGDNGDDGAAPADSPAGESITIANFDFGDPITITAGGEIVVTNGDGVGHTWTSAEPGVFSSDFLDAGEEFRQVLSEPGTYEFFCEIHPSMTGSVTVVPE